MPYIGRELDRGNYLKLDDISSSFNNSLTTFNLTNGGKAFYPGSAFSILVVLAGVVQEPETAYQINQAQITFASAPLAGDQFFCIALGVALGVNTPANGSVNGTQLAKPFNYDGYFYLDDTNNRVGIATATPQKPLHVVGEGQFDSVRVLGDLTVDGTTTTLDTVVTEVDKLEVLANNSTVAVAVTQSGSGDAAIFMGGNFGIGTNNPAYALDVKQTDTTNPLTIAAKGGTDGGGYFWESNSGTTYGAVGYGKLITANSGSANSAITTWGSQDLLLGTNRVERLRIHSSGKFSFGTGTASAAKYTFNSAGTNEVARFESTDAGAYLAIKDSSSTSINFVEGGGDVLSLGVNSVERLRITTSGIGIGTDNPQSQFEVHGSSPIIRSKHSTSQKYTQINHNGTDGYLDWSSGELIFRGASNTERLRITSAGTLDFKTADGVGINFRESGYINIDSDNDDSSRNFTFYDAKGTGSESILMRILDTGNVGIATATPTQKLEVLGSTLLKGTTSTATALMIKGAGTQGDDATISFTNGYTQTFKIGMSDDIGPARDFIISETSTGSSSDNENPKYIFNGNGDGIFQITDRAGGDIKVQLATSGTSYLNGGNVGIGTNNPNALLHLYKDAAGNLPLIQTTSNVANAGSFTNNYSVEFRHATSTVAHGMLVVNNEANDARRTLDIADSNGVFATFTNGKFGIGTTSPDYITTIAGNSGNAKLNLKRLNAASNGNAFGSLFYTNSDGTDVASVRAHRQSAADDAYLGFATRNTGGSLTERVRITSDGMLNFSGQTNSTGTAAISHHTNNNLYIRGGTSGLVLGNHDGTNIIHISNSNHISFETTDGTERLRIRSDGRIAIGTQTINTDSMLSIHRSSSDQSQIRFTNTTTGAGGNNGLIVGIDNNEHGRIFNMENHPLRLGTNNTERLRITSTGGVTIGSGNNDASMSEFGSNTGGLTIDDVGGSNTGIRLSHGNDDSYLVQAGNGNFYVSQYGAGVMIFGVGSSGNERLRILNNGKVGINSTAPTARLDIDHPHTEQGLIVRSRYGNIATAMVKFDGDPGGNGGDGNVLHIHGGNSRTDSEILQVDSTGCGNIFQIRGDGLIRQTLTKNNFTESHWYNHTTNGYIIEYDNNDVLTLTKNVNTSNYDTICYRRITMSKNCDIEFDLKGNSPTTTHRHVGFTINGDGGNNLANMDRLVFRYRPSSTGQNLIRLDAGGGGTTFSQTSSSIPNFFDGTYRHILIQIRDRIFRIYSNGVLVNSYRASSDLVRSSGWFGVSIYEASTSGTPTISIKNFSIRNHIIKPNFLVRASGVNVDVSAGNNLPFNTVVVDRGGNYNTSSYYFSAPVHGMYYFFFNAYRNSSTGNFVSIYRNNTEMIKCRPVPNGGDFVFHGAGMIYLDKGDNVSCVAGDLIDNFYGNNEQKYSSFGGYLVD